MWNRFIFVLIGLIMITTLSGCGGETDATTKNLETTTTSKTVEQIVDDKQQQQLKENAKEIYLAIKNRYEKNEKLSDYEKQLIKEFYDEKASENNIVLKTGVVLLATSFDKYREAIDNQGAPADNKYKKEVDKYLSDLSTSFK